MNMEEKTNLSAEKVCGRARLRRALKESLRFLLFMAAAIIIIMTVRILTDGMYLLGLPDLEEIEAVSIAYPDVTDEIREVTDPEKIELALQLTGFLKYDLFKEAGTQQPLITLTCHLKDGTDLTLSANRTTVWWKDKAYAIKDKEMFVNLTEGIFFPEVYSETISADEILAMAGMPQEKIALLDEDIKAYIAEDLQRREDFPDMTYFEAEEIFLPVKVGDKSFDGIAFSVSVFQAGDNMYFYPAYEFTAKLRSTGEDCFAFGMGDAFMPTESSGQTWYKSDSMTEWEIGGNLMQTWGTLNQYEFSGSQLDSPGWQAMKVKGCAVIEGMRGDGTDNRIAVTYVYNPRKQPFGMNLSVTNFGVTYDLQDTWKVILSASNGLAGYEEKDGMGYLTVLYGEEQRGMKVRVPDENLQNRLAETPLEEIQTLYLDIHIPRRKLKELGLNKDAFENGFDVLSSGLYDEYVSLADVQVR